MGIEFITAKQGFIRKMYDGGRKMLDTVDLLPSEETWEDQLVLFEVHHGFSLIEGEELLVQVSGQNLMASRGYDVVAAATAPPPTVLRAIQRAHGVVLSRVVRYSSLSNTADLAFRFQQ